MLSNNHSSPIPSPHPWPLPIMVDSQTSPSDNMMNSAMPPASLATTVQQRPLVKSIASQSKNPVENQDIKSNICPNTQTAQVVVAKYSYEPLQFSPNDHPEVELPLRIGEYYLTYGDVDEVSRELMIGITYNVIIAFRMDFMMEEIWRVDMV